MVLNFLRRWREIRGTTAGRRVQRSKRATAVYRKTMLTKERVTHHQITKGTKVDTCVLIAPETATIGLMPDGSSISRDYTPEQNTERYTSAGLKYELNKAGAVDEDKSKAPLYVKDPVTFNCWENWKSYLLDPDTLIPGNKSAHGNSDLRELDVDLLAELWVEAAYLPRSPKLLRQLVLRGKRYFNAFNTKTITNMEKADLIIRTAAAAMVISPFEQWGARLMRNHAVNANINQHAKIAKGKLHVRWWQDAKLPTIKE